MRAARESEFVLAANDYSSAQWRHGVAIDANGKGGRGFYFVIDDAGANPVRKGGVLRFPAAGRARVLDIAVEPQGGRFAVFVTVDRDLDPERDGFPHAIHVLP
jgi:hypothetical protein